MKILATQTLKKSKLFVINSAIIMLSALIIKIISSTFDIFLANKIGAEAIGVYSLIMSIYMFAVTIATSGVNLAATKVISEELETNNSGNVPRIVKRCFLYSFLMGIFACILLIVFAPYICKDWLMNKVSHTVIYALAISLPFISMTSAISGYFLAVRNVLRTSISQIAGQLMRISIVFTLIMYVFPNSINNSALALVIGGTVSEFISFIFLYTTYIKDKKKHNTLKYKNVNLTKRILKISLPIAITSYIRSGLNTLKQIIIPIRLKLSGMSYTKAIAEYGIICGMAIPIIMFPSVIVYSYSSLLVPEFSRYSVHDNKSVMRRNIDRMFKITLYFSIAIAGILMYFGKDIGSLLYNAQDVGWYIKIMAPLIVLMYLDNVIDNILKGLGKQVSVMCCNILDLVISVSFIYFLLPIFGSVGYIIVMYISEILNYTISVVTLFKETELKFKYFEWIILPVICIVLAIFISSMFSFSYFSCSTTLILKLILCLIFYSCFIAIINTVRV